MRVLAPFSFVCILLIGLNTIFAQNSQNKGLEVGISVGTPFINGEVRNEFRIGSIGLELEKSLTEKIGIRYQATLGDARGQDWRKSTLPQFRNYRNIFVDQSLQVVSYLTRPQSKFNVSLSGGISVLSYHTEMDLLGENGFMYSYENVSAPLSYTDRSLILNDLEAIQDGDYETLLKGDPLSKDYGRDAKFRVGLTGGIGVQYPLSEKVALNLAYRISWHGDAWLDGVNTSRLGTETNKNDFLHLPSVGLVFHVGKISSPTPQPVQEAQSQIPAVDDDQYAKVEGRLASVENALYQLDRQVMDNTSKTTVLSEKIAQQKTAIADLANMQARTSQDKVFTRSIFFELGKYKVITAHFSSLAQVSSYAEAYSDKKFEILGYADQSGDIEANNTLARKRAEAVVHFLIHTFGIDETRLSVIVVGEVTDADAQADIAIYRKVVVRSL